MKIFVPLLLGITLVVFALFNTSDYVASANTSALSSASLLVANNLQILIVAGLVIVISIVLFVAVKR